MLGKSCVVFLHDVCVFGKTFEEKLTNFREVFTRIRAANLTIRPDKCKFFQSKVKYLGHVCHAEGISCDPSNLNKVQNWPRPTNATQVRGFVSLCSYYRRLVKDFATIAKPLHEVARPNVPFIWTDECEHAFLTLREILVSDPIVSYQIFPVLLFSLLMHQPMQLVLCYRKRLTVMSEL